MDRMDGASYHGAEMEPGPSVETNISEVISESSKIDQVNTQASSLQIHDNQELVAARRFRTLTAKGTDYFQSRIQRYIHKLSLIKEDIDDDENIFKSGSCDTAMLCDVSERLKKSLIDYVNISEEYTDWLKKENSESGNRALDAHRNIAGQIRDSAQALLSEIRDSIRAMDLKSASKIMVRHRSDGHKSSGSGSIKSRSSSATCILLKQKAKAEAAKTRLEFANQEAELQRRKAELETNISLLYAKRDSAIAEAELQGMYEEVDNHSIDYCNNPGNNQIYPHDEWVDKQERIDQYIRQQNRLRNQSEVIDDSHTCTPKVHHEQDISKFLMKKELLVSSLSKFDDSLENFRSWKTTFCSVMSEMCVTPSEEIDLLVKWLGPESNKFAISMKVSNASNPSSGLKKIWDRLEERYGSPEMVEQSLKRKLQFFLKGNMREKKKLYELLDILSEIQSTKEDEKYKLLFGYFDTPAGVNPIISKLHPSLQGKWRDQASNYKRIHHVVFPPFDFFIEFVRKNATILNDPGFMFDSDITNVKSFPVPMQRSRISVNKTSVSSSAEKSPFTCVIHRTDHALRDCRVFRAKSFEERIKLLKDHGICFRCCETKDHLSKDCIQSVTCTECGSKTHVSGMHKDQYHPTGYGGENTGSSSRTGNPVVYSKCTEIYKGEFGGKSCAKIIPLRIKHESRPMKTLKVYAILDEQSNRSLGRKELFDAFNLNCQAENYTLSSCSGRVLMSGRRANGFTIQSVDGKTKMTLPTVIECEDIPNNRDEIATSEIARYYKHLRPLASKLPPLDEKSEILLLIGRDMPEAHHIINQVLGLPSEPYAQELKLGWVVIGETCLGGRHAPNEVSVVKTYIDYTGRASLLEPCENNFHVRDDGQIGYDHNSIGSSIFNRTKNDDKQGMSVNDKIFLKIMDEHFHQDDNGNWSAPLPFKNPRPKLRNNRTQALKRAQILDRSLQKDPVKREHFLHFMQGLFDRGHAERDFILNPDEECWYLPLFGVYHPRKRDKIRGVFDSSAKFEGVALNDVLLSGPDLTNSLLGVLMRFRKEKVAVTADIEQMFYCFSVQDNHRKYLRFLWHQDNDMDKPLVDFHMTVHVFGNRPSPAVATYGLHKAAEMAENSHGKDVTDFVRRNFYVDDGLSSHSTSIEATDLLKRTKSALQSFGNLHLHKISSNSEEVLSAFPKDDLVKELKSLDLGNEELPTQSSLGVCWKLEQDAFTFQLSPEEKPFIRRGVLSIINGIYDPLGFIAPVTIEGKLLLRKTMSNCVDWDEPLPSENRQEWEAWKDSLQLLRNLYIPRIYSSASLKDSITKELHVFSDASEKAIAAACYLKTTGPQGSQELSFVLGKAKVAPKHGHTIPRLELCGAVLAVELSEIVLEELDVNIDIVQFYTDSKVVLGYLNNETKRFFIYVSNRVDRIRKSTNPEQWHYVPTGLNPADCATRSVPAGLIQNSVWLKGPTHLLNNSGSKPCESAFPLVNPEDDVEVRALKMEVKPDKSKSLGSHRFEKFSSWRTLVKAIAVIKHSVVSFRDHHGCKNWCSCPHASSVDTYVQAEQCIIRVVQHEIFNKEIATIQDGQPLPKDSSIRKLDPYLDQDCMLRVGGRIRQSSLEIREKNPLIIPNKSHIANLLVHHFHEQTKHQGRHFTEGAVRAAGFWIVGGKKLVSSLIYKCVPCRRLRGKQENNKMADLPADRLEPAPPFTNIGVDVFGPWSIVTRRTRGGIAQSKRWAVIFVCLVVRAIHIEVIEDMSASSFVNALRRFTAIRGEVKVIRSDRGSNFIGSIAPLHVTAINVEDGPVKDYLGRKGTIWIFNAPHSSHMGGAWERLIGISRKVLDSTLLHVASKNLTHEVLVTLMAEVCSIVNARPLVPVSTDPESPFILSPATLLTMKNNHAVQSFSLEEFNIKDLYKQQWKQVQYLANQFWSRWRREYLPTIQVRRKWQDNNKNLKEGDVVLLKDKSLHRNDWPLGIIEKTLMSGDECVRKVEVRLAKDSKVFTRPISEIVLLLSDS